jgi:hypothetical protein
MGQAGLFPRTFFRSLAAVPAENAKLGIHQLPNEMPLLRKQILFPYAKNFGKEFKLFAGNGTALRFHAGQDVTGHVDISNALQSDDEVGLRPTPQVAFIRNPSPGHIGIFWHDYLR